MPPDEMLVFAPAAECAARREALLERMGPGAVLVLASTPVHLRNGDVEHPYRQDSDVYYLTGVDEPDTVLVLSTAHEHRFALFVRPRDPEREMWDGPRVGVEGACEQIGADAAHPIDSLDAELPGYLENARVLHAALGRHPSFDTRLLAALRHVKRRQRQGVLAPSTIVDASSAVHAMRLRKSQVELDRMRRAAAATYEGHLAAMRVARPGVYEYEVEAELIRAFRRAGCERSAYESIVGSGPNACVLHYRKNDRRMNEGDLLLIDAGAEYAYYAADVTRTFPISGTYSPAQRKIYEVVLEAQKRAVDSVRPGVTVEAVHDVALRVMVEGLIALGLIEGPLDDALAEERHKPFAPHRTSHWLGMDVHDVGAYYEHDATGAVVPVAMGAGMVLTVEPGIYVPLGAPDVPVEFHGVGVRIEDDVLVTASGHDNLTAAIPKEIAEVERILRERSSAGA